MAINEKIELCECSVIHEDVLQRVREKMPPEEPVYEVSELFKVFGDSTRARIICALNVEEMCVCDLATLLNMTVNAVRAHRRGMMRLRKADWLDLAKTVLAALIMAPAVWFVGGKLSSDFAMVAVGAAVGMAVYFPLTLLFRCECITGIIKSFLRK